MYGAILQKIDVGIMALDMKRRSVVFQNDKAKDLCEGILDELISEIESWISEASAASQRTMRRNNSLIGYTAYRVAGGFVWTFMRDITERARLESVAEAMNSAENTGFIFSSIRHELGNPLNSVKISLTVLKRDLELDDLPKETILEYLDRAVFEVSRMETLLSSLKSFSMFDGVALEPVGLGGFLKEFLELVELKLKGRGIALVCEPGVYSVAADVRVLYQVFLNLLNNSIDALETVDEPQIYVGASGLGNVVKITFRDNGCGIPEGQQEYLLKPFFTTKPKGTGLGLVICSKLLAKMNGYLEITSEEGVGTSVDMYIPMSESRSATQSQDRSESSSSDTDRVS